MQYNRLSDERKINAKPIRVSKEIIRKIYEVSSGNKILRFAAQLCSQMPCSFRKIVVKKNDFILSFFSIDCLSSECKND